MINETATPHDNHHREPSAETPPVSSDASPGADAARWASGYGDSSEPISNMPSEIQPETATPGESSSAPSSTETEHELSSTPPCELPTTDNFSTTEPETGSPELTPQQPGPTEGLDESTVDVKPDSGSVSAEHSSEIIAPASTAEPALTSDEPAVLTAATATQSDQKLDSAAGPAPEEAIGFVEESTGSASEVAANTSAPAAETVPESTESSAKLEVAAEHEESTGSGGGTSPKTEPPAKPKRTRKKAATGEAGAAAVTVAESTSAPAATPAEEPPPPENKKKWYAIKVQSGREDTIKAAILRKVAIEGLEQYVGQIVIPVEEVVEKKTVRIKDKKTGEYTTQERKVTKKKKKFHGYIFAELEFNDRILYLFRETSGVGDFLNMRGKPPVPEPMPEHEVQSMLTGITVKDPLKRAKFKLDFEKGDRVRIREGSFINNEGEVKEISEVKDPTDTPKVKVELTFWGRPLEVELDASQVEKI